ncbi:MAG: hypothetical protein KatS3mg003_1189 [Candidatus Nitrosocaldaceae archaeon]|nr:MAG: hypothetical protein KatS3mg003_1189 [Candidatus Nitrosocaldaceae archaeon]
MSNINLYDIVSSRLFIVSLIIFLSIAISISYVYTSTDINEPILRLTTFGQNMSIADYYPSESPFIRVGEEVNWNVQIYNKMGKSELVQLRFGIANATNKQVLYEEIQLIANNSTYLLPLKWHIKAADIETRDNNTYSMIKQIVINNNEVNVNIMNTNGTDFRAVIELLRYNENTNKFEYGDKVRWNEIWFRIE